MAIFYNQATLTYSGGVVRSNITTGELLEALTVTKTAVSGEYSYGSDITYAVNIINSGERTFSGLTLTDDLGAYTFNSQTLYPLEYEEGSVKYFVNGVLQTAPAVVVNGNLTISGISIPSDSVVTILYTVNVNEFAPVVEGSAIENTVVLSGDCVTGISATETINVGLNAELQITKSLFPPTITECEQLTYTILIQNFGNRESTVADNAVVTDTFDPILKNIVVTYNGEVWSSPENYTYDENTGVFRTNAGQITVPAATTTQNPVTGEWETVPGSVIITVTGNL